MMGQKILKYTIFSRKQCQPSQIKTEFRYMRESEYLPVWYNDNALRMKLLKC